MDLPKVFLVVRWAERRLICPELVNVGVYRCAILEFRRRYNAFIAWTLKLIETSPVLSEALRTEEKTFDFGAVLVSLTHRVASFPVASGLWTSSTPKPALSNNRR